MILYTFRRKVRLGVRISLDYFLAITASSISDAHQWCPLLTRENRVIAASPGGAYSRRRAALLTKPVMSHAAFDRRYGEMSMETVCWLRRRPPDQSSQCNDDYFPGDDIWLKIIVREWRCATPAQERFGGTSAFICRRRLLLHLKLCRRPHDYHNKRIAAKSFETRWRHFDVSYSQKWNISLLRLFVSCILAYASSQW